ncbi:MAG TPA: 4Fe-4S double cluster binding domain-containing protein [Bacillota bacterium]
MGLVERLHELALSEGITHFGVADLGPAGDFIAAQGGRRLLGFPRAISLGADLSDAMVEPIEDQDDRGPLLTYRYYIYEMVNRLLNQAATRVTAALQAEGAKAYAIPASHSLDTDRLCGLFSHKLAARLAGLGWIGKNCLLITPEHGPRVRFATVLTDADLPTGQPLPDGCGTCEICVKTCLSGAIVGRAFDQAEPREARFLAKTCEARSKKRKEALGITDPGSLCGLCVLVCPYGSRP